MLRSLVARPPHSSRPHAAVTFALVGLCLLLNVGPAYAQSPQNPPQRRTSIIPPPIRDPDRTSRRYVRSWKTIREENIVMQRFDYSCGAAALATLIRYYWGDPMTEDRVLEAILDSLTADEIRDRIENGLSITDLRLGAVKLGYPAILGQRTMPQLLEAKVPVIVRLVDEEFEHFVVYRGMVGDRVFVADPIRGNIRMPVWKFLQQWLERGEREGIILVVAKMGVTQLPENAPLLVQHPPWLPVVPELQAARRGLHLLNTARPEVPLRP